MENLKLHANFMAVCFIERELLRSKFYIAGIGIFDLFRSCDLDLDLMTFIYRDTNLARVLWRHRPTACAKMNFIRPVVHSFESYRLTDKHADRTCYDASRVVKDESGH